VWISSFLEACFVGWAWDSANQDFNLRLKSELSNHVEKNLNPDNKVLGPIPMFSLLLTAAPSLFIILTLCSPCLLLQATTALSVSLEGIAGSTAPLKSFDPLKLAELGSDETFAWFQAAELKHGRAAMVATTGFLIQANGIHFPAMLSKDISCESLSSMHPVDQWAAVPEAGKYYMRSVCVLSHSFRSFDHHFI
jgi:hypothetical protein